MWDSPRTSNRKRNAISEDHQLNCTATGKTERQWIDEMKLMELTQEQGIRPPIVATCYLCKRAEGEKSLRLMDDDDDPILADIKLEAMPVSLNKSVNLVYLLCQECAVLMLHRGKDWCEDYCMYDRETRITTLLNDQDC
jgi:hypothetical protein